MMHILQLLLTEEHTTHILEKIDSITPDDIFISERMIQHLLEIMEQSRIKLILFFQQYRDTVRAPPDFHEYTKHEIITYLLKYQTSDYEHPFRGAYSLSLLYYNTQGSFSQNARLLFGTASQFRR